MARNPNAGEQPAPAHSLRRGTRVGAVVSTFHADLTRAMLDSARRELIAAGLNADDLIVVEVAGSLELPLIARCLAIRDDIAAVLCFGLVLKGETPHDKYIAQTTCRGILDVSMQTDKPVLFGVLTCDTIEQARARALPVDAGGTHDKGAEVARAALAALAALEQVNALDREQGPVGFAAKGFATEVRP